MKILRTDTWTLEGLDPAFQAAIKSFEVPSDHQHFRRWDIPDNEWLIIAIKHDTARSIPDYEKIEFQGIVLASNCWVETQSVDSGERDV